MLRERLQGALAARRLQHLHRRRRVLEGPQDVTVRLGDRALVSFCSNDYLGLANHPDVVRALAEGARRYGVGAGASHLVSGHLRVHHEIEEELADFAGRPRALLFSTGYMANLGLLQALTQRHTEVFEDRLNHASLIDAARLAGARVRRIPHGDLASLERRLAAPLRAGPERVVVTDGVFSMDGDLAPLPALAALCRRYDAMLVVDDAHGLGVLGATGRGIFEALHVLPAPEDVLMGTLGKAFGVFGAFVAGDDLVIDTLIQGARTYLYTTALPPALACAVRASLAIIRAEPWRREALALRIAEFRQGAGALGLRILPSQTPIQGILLGGAEQALDYAMRLERLGFLIPAIRPPTVPAGTARLRVTLSAAHTPAQVQGLLAALAEVRSAEQP